MSAKQNTIAVLKIELAAATARAQCDAAREEEIRKDHQTAKTRLALTRRIEREIRKKLDAAMNWQTAPF